MVRDDDDTDNDNHKDHENGKSQSSDVFIQGTKPKVAQSYQGLLKGSAGAGNPMLTVLLFSASTRTPR